jgi:organic radical activating enzyme
MEDWIAECEVAEIAVKIASFNCKNIILTGGEPMMQQERLSDLMALLKEHIRGVRFETETNGTISPTPEFDALIDQYNVSPKLSNSNNPKKLREKPDALRFFAQSPKSVFKFVIADASDLSEVLEMINMYRISEEKVWLMPEGTTPSALARRREWLVEICKEYGFRFSDRLHVQIWGSKKGV